MEIRSFAHKGLKKLYLRDDASGFSPAVADKVRKMLAFLQDIENPEELWLVSAWKVHKLKGDRKGAWSLRVTANWRLTFQADGDEIIDLNYEDYH